LPIDELGNWCQERLVRALCKYEAQQGGFHGDPVSGNQPKATPPLQHAWREEGPQTGEGGTSAP